MAGKFIAGGAWCEVWVTKGNREKKLGLCNQASYDEDWGVAPANVVGFHGPVSYDSQGYSCRVTLGTFRPEKDPGEDDRFPQGDGDITLDELLTTRDKVQQDGRAMKFDSMEFRNIRDSRGPAVLGTSVLAKFEDVILASNGMQIAPNTYVTSNMAFMAVKRSLPDPNDPFAT